MVKRVTWTPRAQNERKEVLKYWIRRTKSKTYSQKLNLLIKQAIRLIREYPKIGKPTDIDNVRIKIVRDYLIFYELVEDELHILAFWDSRQNPEKLKLK
ncbi:MAG: type II toxin-antitoxin system RelE/ParE family toxin [Roseivirga sp.]|nr:type II toxin-antitoxin system RelE/ParE family toxin [Roseivirga sp.]